MGCLNQKLMLKPIQQASNGYPFFKICHLYITCIYRIQDHTRDAELEKLDWKAATTPRSIGLSTKPFSSELTLARPYAMRTAAQPPTSTTSIPDVDSAREDLPDDTHVITFQRKLYDSFTK